MCGSPFDVHTLGGAGAGGGSGKGGSGLGGGGIVGGATESVGELFPQGLVPSGNEAKLAAKTQFLLADRSNEPRVNTFVLEHMQRQTLEVYERLLATERRKT